MSWCSVRTHLTGENTVAVYVVVSCIHTLKGVLAKSEELSIFVSKCWWFFHIWCKWRNAWILAELGFTWTGFEPTCLFLFHCQKALVTDWWLTLLVFWHKVCCSFRIFSFSISCEEWMLHALTSCWTLIWIKSQHLVYYINCIRWCLRYDFF